MAHPERSSELFKIANECDVPLNIGGLDNFSDEAYDTFSELEGERWLLIINKVNGEVLK